MKNVHLKIRNGIHTCAYNSAETLFLFGNLIRVEELWGIFPDVAEFVAENVKQAR